MRRAVTASVLAAAVVVGVAAGIVAHRYAPAPFGGSTAGPSSTASSGSGLPTPTAAPSPSRTASPPASPPPTPPTTPSPTPAPAFTRLALLQPEEFVAHGWATARQIDEFDTIPAAPITPCASVEADQEGLVAAYAATYASQRTEAAELVVRLDSSDRAEAVFQRLRALIAGCAELRVTASHHPDVAEPVSDLRWWNTRETGAATRGVIGLVRADDRIALLALRSDVSDPAETTQITSLLELAGYRLV